MSSLLPVYERDLTLVRGKGARLFDSSGRSYLDFAAGIGVNGLGYGDAKVLAAIRRQAAALIHASNLFHNEPASALAERLSAVSFPSRVFFCNSGAEACEAAMKFARKIGRESGRSEFLCFEGAFHGRTFGALSATWKEAYR
ncbi:MAG TPA: aminotransferase class III-fold pyridoxal phosphate-dependent enzyme, partial [Vicinamibacteria bacterium]|nr:aminotransferase class III-fold pyridoxal phosphate-dependent enzyme [Vicinamibacteria bacterium]